MRLREHAGIIAGRIDILYCKPSEITVEEGYNVRDLTTAEARAELDELKAQVKEHGVQTPLKIRFNGEQIILVEGHRRRTVALELIAEYEASGGTQGRNIESVPIFPEAPGTTVEERDAGLFVSNTGSRLKPLEFANLIYRMHKQRGLPLEAVAQRLAISMHVLKNHLDMRGMSEPVKQHVRDGNISATLAAKISKNADPVQAEELIRANMEENKRLKGKSRVTPKTIARATKPKAESKPPAEANAPATVPFEPLTLKESDLTHIATRTFSPEEIAGFQTGAPVSGATSLDQLQDQIAGLTEGRPPITRVLTDEEKKARAAFLANPAAPHASSKIKALLHGFVDAELHALAPQYANLCRELEETRAESGDAMQGQEELCVAADVIGRLLYPDDWDNAKASTELAQVA